MALGIDYGGGLTNINIETGIRYGVISQHTVGEAWYDSAIPDFGNPTCPKCGAALIDYDSDKHGDFESLPNFPGCCDYACENCQSYLDSADAFSEEPLSWSYEEKGYLLCNCLDSDIMILKSPYYTYADFCSPCVPGAGNLDDWKDGAVRTYCLGHDWFEEKVAPYPVYSVETNAYVRPEE